MRAQLFSDNTRDFNQRYASVYGFLLTENSKILVYVSNVTDRECSFVDSSGMKYSARAGGGAEFEFIPVTRGWYATRKGPVLLQRVAARQFKRGICEDNTNLFTLDIKKDSLVSAPLNWDILNDVFVAPPTSQDAAATGAYFILGKYFVITPTSLWFYDKRIGSVDYMKKEISLDFAHVRQEIVDLFHRANLDWKVNTNV